MIYRQFLENQAESAMKINRKFRNKKSIIQCLINLKQNIS